MRRKYEKAEHSCRVLVDLLATEEDEDRRAMLLDDYAWKSRALQPATRNYLNARALASFVNEDIAARFREAETPTMTMRRADVAILTVKRPELLAVQTALEISPNEQEDHNINGLRCWERQIDSADGASLDVVISMVGEAGNVASAAASYRVFNTYDVGLCCLVGTAAGLRSKVALGDVVAAEIVLDYERARLEPSGPKKRPVPCAVGIRIGRDLANFDPRRFGWYDCFDACCDRLRDDPYESLPATEDGWRPTFHSGVVLSGEKLVADGSMEALRSEYHDRVRALDTDSAGFARACAESAVPWLVFRGISDFGDAGKDDQWQVLSCLSAATAARVFLENGYRKPAAEALVTSVPEHAHRTPYRALETVGRRGAPLEKGEGMPDWIDIVAETAQTAVGPLGAVIVFLRRLRQEHKAKLNEAVARSLPLPGKLFEPELVAQAILKALPSDAPEGTDDFVIAWAALPQYAGIPKSELPTEDFIRSFVEALMSLAGQRQRSIRLELAEHFSDMHEIELIADDSRIPRAQLRGDNAESRWASVLDYVKGNTANGALLFCNVLTRKRDLPQVTQWLRSLAR